MKLSATYVKQQHQQSRTHHHLRTSTPMHFDKGKKEIKALLNRQVNSTYTMLFRAQQAAHSKQELTHLPHPRGQHFNSRITSITCCTSDPKKKSNNYSAIRSPDPALDIQNGVN